MRFWVVLKCALLGDWEQVGTFLAFSFTCHVSLWCIKGDQLLPVLGNGTKHWSSSRIEGVFLQHLLLPQAAGRRRRPGGTRSSEALDQSCRPFLIWPRPRPSPPGCPLGFGCKSHLWWLYFLTGVSLFLEVIIVDNCLFFQSAAYFSVNYITFIQHGFAVVPGDRFKIKDGGVVRLHGPQTWWHL